MCWANKCCFCIKLNLGSVSIGLISLLFAIVMTLSSVVCLSMDTHGTIQDAEHKSNKGTLPPPHPVLEAMGLNVEWSHSAFRIILCSTIAMGLFLKLASILLLIGIVKKKPGFVLFYFGFGIFFTIFSNLAALLLLLSCKWAAALIIFITCCIYIHFLVVIHTIYDKMQKGGWKLYRSTSRNFLIENDALAFVTEDTMTS